MLKQEFNNSIVQYCINLKKRKINMSRINTSNINFLENGIKFKTSFTQNNYFKNYNCNQNYHQNIKKQCVNLGKDLIILITKDLLNKKEMLNKLSDITIRIQKRINRGSLTNNSIKKYKKELENLMPENTYATNTDNINNFILCCILLSKHTTSENTKLNWFNFTNKTTHLKYFADQKTSKFENIEQMSEINLLSYFIKYFNLKNNNFSFILINKLNNIININNVIKNNIFFKSQEVSATLINLLHNMNVTSIEAQINITDAIKNNIFFKSQEVSDALINLLHNMNVTNIEAQINITDAIKNNIFFKSLEVSTALINLLHDMNITNIFAQINITNAIKNNAFFNNPKVSIALINLLRNMDITNIFAQTNITNAINNNVFSNNPEVSIALINLLHKMNITSIPVFQKIIIKAIKNNAFFKSQDISKDLIKLLNKIDITDINIQINIIKAIKNNAFFKSQDISKDLIKLLNKMDITNINIQINITEIIKKKLFFNSQDISKALIKLLNKMDITDINIQINIIKAIKNNVFFYNQFILNGLINLLKKINIFDQDAQKDIKRIIKNFYLDKQKNLQIKRYLFSNWSTNYIKIKDTYIINSDNTKTKIDRNNNLIIPKNFPNNIKVNEQEINLEYTIWQEIADQSLDKKDNFNFGTFGFVYNIEGNPILLIIYCDNSNNSIQNKQEQMEGFFNMEETTYYIYQNNLSYIHLYDLINIHDCYPSLLDTIKNDNNNYPTWLQQAIKFNNFNLEQYKHKNLISFVLNLVNKIIINDNKISSIVTNAIKILIQNQGNTFKIFNDKEKDMAIKDYINEKIPFIPLNINNFIDSFWNSLTKNEDKYKLIFLLGQIAKAGALGYHYGNKNESNYFFYLLAHHFALKLKNSNNNSAIEKLIKQCQEGICIENATNDFMFNLRHLYKLEEVWQKK
jgi:hypothetical protein